MPRCWADGTAGLRPVVLALLIALFSFGGGGNAWANGGTNLFGAHGSMREGLKPFTKWTDALDRYWQEKMGDWEQCLRTEKRRCSYRRWHAFLDSLDGLPPRKQLDRVHAEINRARYITDPVNWGVSDYWESPGQFFSRDGDCEDYAIVKYLSLKALGWNVETMRIVVLFDLNLRIAHAVLAVDLNERTYILDNQIAVVANAERIKHYRPIYSVNETRWWRYRAGR